MQMMGKHLPFLKAEARGRDFSNVLPAVRKDWLLRMARGTSVAKSEKSVGEPYGMVTSDSDDRQGMLYIGCASSTDMD